MNDFEDRLRSRLHGLRDTIEPPPGLWARVEQRTHRPPWIPMTMAAVAAAVLLFALIAGIGGGGGTKRHVVAAGPTAGESTTTTADNTGGVGAPPTSQGPDSPSTTSAPTATAPPHPPRAVVGVTSTTTPPATTVTTQLQNCSSHDVSLTATTDKANYAQGEAVNISVTATNTSSHPCQIPPDCGITAEGATVTDSKGRTVWVAPHAGVMCTNPPPPPTVLQPGQSTQPGTFAQFTWNQEDCPAPPGNCPGTQVPAGTYGAQGTWRFADGTATGQPTDFRIT